MRYIKRFIHKIKTVLRGKKKIAPFVNSSASEARLLMERHDEKIKKIFGIPTKDTHA